MSTNSSIPSSSSGDSDFAKVRQIPQPRYVLRTVAPPPARLIPSYRPRFNSIAAVVICDVCGLKHVTDSSLHAGFPGTCEVCCIFDTPYRRVTLHFFFFFLHACVSWLSLSVCSSSQATERHFFLPSPFFLFKIEDRKDQFPSPFFPFFSTMLHSPYTETSD